jgi:hypothetical protein
MAMGPFSLWEKDRMRERKRGTPYEETVLLPYIVWLCTAVVVAVSVTAF